jgi:hypothetical protein
MRINKLLFRSHGFSVAASVPAGKCTARSRQTKVGKSRWRHPGRADQPHLDVGLRKGVCDPHRTRNVEYTRCQPEVEMSWSRYIVSMAARPHTKADAVLSAALILASFSCPQRAAATVVDYLVYVDEDGHSFYVGPNLSHVDPKSCRIHTNTQGSIYKCPLNYEVLEGVPTITSPEAFTQQITTGDILVNDPAPNSDTNSDLLRFSADKLQFYSKPDQNFSTDVKTPITEIDLTNQTDIQIKGKEAVGNVPVGLAGLWGVSFVAGPGDVGGPSKNTQKGTQFGYIFVSDVDVAKSDGKSVHFDSTTSQLSFSNDFVTDTGSTGDPLVGAAVNMPTFVLQGVDSDGGVLFNPLGGGQFTLGLGGSTYLEATVGSLTYSPSENLFSATLSNFFVAGVDPTSNLYDPNLPAFDSTFLQYIDSVFNVNSWLFDPNASLSITYSPDSNFFAQTAAFTSSAESPITNIISIVSTPEPNSFLLFCAGCLLIRRRLWKSVRRCFQM